MKILHLLDSLNRGGAEMQVLDLCRNAARYGMEVVFAAAGGGALEEDFRDSGAKFYRLQRRLPIDPHMALYLRRIIRRENVGIVHGYQAVEGIHLYMAAMGMKRVKKVLSFQGGIIPDKKNLKALKFLIPRMNANIAVSESLRIWHKEQDGLDTERNFHVVFNGADEKRLISHNLGLRKELNLPEGALLFGMNANFYPERRKDQMTICRALPQVFSEVPNAYCIFAGKVAAGGETKFEECKAICKEAGIAERVHFLGGRKDIPDILASLDVFVFSSFYEGLPVAVTEAMLAGLPCILSDIGPLREVSDDGRAAEIFPVEDHEALAEKLIAQLKDAGARKELAERSKAFALENFSIGAHLRSLKALYESLLQK